MNKKVLIDPFYLAHHGILGQKWGVRRYQNTDGTLTEAGKKRYRAESVTTIDNPKGLQKRLNDLDKAMAINKRKNTDAVRKIIKRRRYASKAVATKTITEENITKGQKEVENLLAANKDKYTIKTLPTRRNVTNGKDVLAGLGNIAIGNVLAYKGILLPSTPLGYGIATGIGALSIPRTTKGTHYSVKEKALKAPTETVHVVKVSDDQINRWAKEIEAENKKYDLGINNSKKNRQQKIL